MPICHYGGAKCSAGPGASGSSAIVHEHEVQYHGKPKKKSVKGCDQFNRDYLGKIDDHLRYFIKRKINRQSGKIQFNGVFCRGRKKR